MFIVEAKHVVSVNAVKYLELAQGLSCVNTNCGNVEWEDYYVSEVVT